MRANHVTKYSKTGAMEPMREVIPVKSLEFLVHNTGQIDFLIQSVDERQYQVSVLPEWAARIREVLNLDPAKEFDESIPTN